MFFRCKNSLQDNKQYCLLSCVFGCIVSDVNLSFCNIALVFLINFVVTCFAGESPPYLFLTLFMGVLVKIFAVK